MLDNKLIAENLGKVKQNILESVQKGASPSVIESARNAIMFLDTTFLWCSQIAQFQEMQSEQAVEKAVADAAKAGKIVEVDFSKNGK